MFGRRSTPTFYFINLDRRSDRRRFQEIQARLHGFSLVRVPAKDGSAGEARLPASVLSPGARGLWVTFVDLCDSLDAAGVPVAVVLEDDAVLRPFFGRSLLRVLEQAPADAALIQMGHIGSSAWRSNNSLWRNVKKFLRPRSRLRSAMDHRHRRSQGGAFRQDLSAGTHCLVVFPQRMKVHLANMKPGEMSLDRAFVDYAERYPGSFIRTRTNSAYQFPFSSDIPWMRARG